jgi:hypothetical protein
MEIIAAMVCAEVLKTPSWTNSAESGIAPLYAVSDCRFNLPEFS